MYDSDRLAAILDAMAAKIAAQSLPDPILIGIRTGGAWLAQRLQAALDPSPPLGTLDISFYRDDFSRVGLNPEVPVAVNNRNIIRVDDVLHTGRTIRAALNEIFSYGRPERVCLALGDHEEAKLGQVDGRLALNIIETGAGGAAR